jgi:hypothetical protein
VAWVRRFILLHNKRHPKDMGASEVRKFLAHLAVNRRVAASTQNQALNAIVFMYRAVLRRDPGEFGEFQRAKRPKRLPIVLTKTEVQQALQVAADGGGGRCHRAEGTTPTGYAFQPADSHWRWLLFASERPGIHKHAPVSAFALLAHCCGYAC